MAPELVKLIGTDRIESAFSHASDVFSFGYIQKKSYKLTNSHDCLLFINLEQFGMNCFDSNIRSHHTVRILCFI